MASQSERHLHKIQEERNTLKDTAFKSAPEGIEDARVITPVKKMMCRTGSLFNTSGRLVNAESDEPSRQAFNSKTAPGKRPASAQNMKSSLFSA